MASRNQQKILSPHRKAVVLGLDFGATYLKALLLDAEGRICARFLSRSESRRGAEAAIPRILAMIERAQHSAWCARMELIAIGVGVCAPLSDTRDEIIASPVLPGWKNVPIGSILTDGCGLPVHLENDANLAILGEWWKGAARNCKVVAGVTLGTGIGGGLVIDGHIYRGAFGFGGEFGHIRVASGPKCPCGGKGCLGVVASATATVARYRRLAGKNNQSVESIRDLVVLLRRGNPVAEKAVLVSACYLADATLMLVNSLNPNVFVLAGGMSVLGSRLVNPIHAHIRAAAFRSVSDSTRITTAGLGAYSGCFGAGYLALNETNPLPGQGFRTNLAHRPNP